MLIALMTDLHANREALSTCLAHAEEQKVTHYAFLGDIVGYGADPGWVLQTVMDYVAKGNWALMGNHDAAILQESRSGMNPVAKQVVEWTRAQLSPEQIAFVAALPYRIELQDMLLVHATLGRQINGNISTV